MRTEERFEEPERREPEPGAAQEPPLAAAELLALQRSAGNSAVGRMLARKFYAQADDGTVVWHKEALDATQWEDTGTTTRWLVWNYPVYRARRSEAATTTAAPKRKRRRRKPAAAAPEAVTQVEEDAVEDETEEAGPEETPPAVVSQPTADDDDDGFTTVKSGAAKKKERDAAVDVAALAIEIDAHEGAPEAVIERFNRLFNARVQQSLDVEGTIASSYVSNYDHGRGGYSIEVTIPSLANWVVHAHLEADGSVAPGHNATHYKRRADQFTLGVSIALLPRQIEALLPDRETRAARRTQRRRRV